MASDASDDPAEGGADFLYANQVEIGVSPVEIRLRFRDDHRAGRGAASRVVEVVMSPEMARRFAGLLRRSLEAPGSDEAPS
jgi:hypothetical protein